MKITIETIPHDKQRYDTVGDYYIDPKEPGHMIIKVSHLSDWRHVVLVALHELVEVILNRYNNIPFKLIDQFDMDWEPPPDIDEPGNDPECPYWDEHQIAEGFERMLAALLQVDWQAYEREIAALSQEKSSDAP